MKPMNYQENYNLPEGSFRISPSMLAKFNDRKHEWYRSQVLGEKVFEGNTSTFLGQCVHRMVEYFLHNQDIDFDEINKYIDDITVLDVDKEYIKEQYPIMGRTLINHLIATVVPEKSEENISMKILDNVYLAGTYDAYHKGAVIDFKTTSSKNPIDSIPYYYKWQLLAYAYILRANDIFVDSIRLIWVTTSEVNRVSEKTGKRLKDYPSIVKEVIEPITDDDMKFIKDYVSLIAETYVKGKENPELVYLLYSDYRLKEHFDSPFNK